MDPEPRHPCIVQIPLVYNDGREVEPETMLEIKQVFDRQFNGYTVIGEMEGSWHGQVETSVRIEVGVPSDRLDQFRELVIAIGERLDQEAMYIDVPPPTAEILPIPKVAKQTGGKQGTLFELEKTKTKRRGAK